MVNYVDIEYVKSLFPKRVQDSNKSTYGKVLNIAGSKLYQGAAYLSSVSALKVGAGYLTLACPDCILNNVASKSPDVTFLPLRSFNNESIASDNASVFPDKFAGYSVISLGCGLTTNSSTEEFVAKILPKIELPLVLDADGLNSVSQLEIRSLPKQTLITPHPKELSRLLNVEISKINADRVNYAILASKELCCVTLLKGNKTVITDGNLVFVNTTGNSALSKAGSGDVLTGMISGFAAQGLSLLDSAVIGAFTHGLCAEIASNDLTEYSVLASDLIGYIPKSIAKILNS